MARASRKKIQDKNSAPKARGREPKGALISLGAILFCSYCLWSARTNYDVVTAKCFLLLSFAALFSMAPSAVFAGDKRRTKYREWRSVALLLAGILVTAAGAVVVFGKIDFSRLSGREAFRAHEFVFAGWIAMILGPSFLVAQLLGENGRERKLKRKLTHDPPPGDKAQVSAEAIPRPDGAVIGTSDNGIEIDRLSSRRQAQLSDNGDSLER